VLTVALFPVPGTYNGLFSDPQGVLPQSSGSFKVTTTGKGKFSGVLQLPGSRFPMSGQFSVDGTVTNLIRRGGQIPLTVVLQAGSTDTDHMTGTVSDGAFMADLLGDRSVFDGRQSLAPQAGQYTIVMAGTNGAADLPGGNSFGTITVNRAGMIRLAGTLADGTPITQGSVTSRDGDWPLFLPLYGGRGLLLSWLKFATSPADDLGGESVWIKPPLPGAKLYPGGFLFRTAASGFHFNRPANGQSLLTLTNATLRLEGSDLGQAIVNQISLGRNNRVINLSSNKLALTFRPALGSFAGRVVDPVTLKTVSFGGVVLQPMDIGIGFFSGNAQTGPVLLGP